MPSSKFSLYFGIKQFLQLINILHLNLSSAKKIVPWLRIIIRSPALLDEFYEPWAYVVQPGKFFLFTRMFLYNNFLSITTYLFFPIFLHDQNLTTSGKS